MKQKYFIHVWVVIFLLFTSGANVFAQSKRDSKTEVAVVNGYRIVKGERPPIDLSKVNADSYEKGKISVKFTPDMERSISQMLIQPQKGSDVVALGNSNIDKLNKEFGAVQYKSMLYGLYEMSAKSAQHKERHKAWGFHLWFEITIDADADIKQAVKKFAALKEVEIAEPVYKKRLIGNVNEKPKAEIQISRPTNGFLTILVMQSNGITITPDSKAVLLIKILIYLKHGILKPAIRM